MVGGPRAKELGIQPDWPAIKGNETTLVPTLPPEETREMGQVTDVPGAGDR
jgi:hypothetical protein